MWGLDCCTGCITGCGIDVGGGGRVGWGEAATDCIWDTWLEDEEEEECLLGVGGLLLLLLLPAPSGSFFMLSKLGPAHQIERNSIILITNMHKLKTYFCTL
jgi:hypothetical protein